jgi:hypothetical protein
MEKKTLDDRPFLEIDTATASANIKTYLAFIQNLVTYVTDKEAYAHIVHQEVTYFEYPNLINRKGQVRGAEKGFEGVAMGKKILAEQQYRFVSIIEIDNKLFVEGVWTGTMAIDAGPLAKGQQLKAYLCMIVEFRDGKIYSQRNYDCYVPFVE